MEDGNVCLTFAGIDLRSCSGPPVLNLTLWRTDCTPFSDAYNAIYRIWRITMNAQNLINWMDGRDRTGAWAFGIEEIRLAFRSENPATTLSALRAHAASGLILRITRGLYANPRAHSLPDNGCEALVAYLRPWDFNYLSLESAASECGLISQIPGRLTFVTSGRGGLFQTPWGDIELVHTRLAPESLSDITFHAGRGIHIAGPQQALADLARFNRSLDLVEEMSHETHPS